MISRIYPAFVVVFWLTTMSWLLVSKVLPPLLGGRPPDYAAALSSRAEKEEPVVWRISWNDKRIGTAASDTVRTQDGGTALRHVVHFEHLPLDAMLSEGFGAVGAMMKPLVAGDGNLEIEMMWATEFRFDAARQFRSLHVVGDLGELINFIRITGEMQPNQKLKLRTKLAGSSPGNGQTVLNHEIHLPRESLVRDAFAPRPELKNLTVGQTWTIPVYRPFPPNSPVQIVEATAERLDVIVWDGRDVETILVVYRGDAGSGLHVSREPLAREWVSADGAVLQQEIRISGLKIRFERLSATAPVPEVELLDARVHPRFWNL